MDVAQRLMAQLKTRQEELQCSVFSSPPKDHAEFCLRRGQWEENQRCQDALLAAVRQQEDL